MLSDIAAALAIAAPAAGTFQSITGGMKTLQEMLSGPKLDKKALDKIVSDLSERLIQAQTTQIAIQSALLGLQEEARRVERFQSEALRYALCQTDMGALVYELKDSHKVGEPKHCLCTTCYEKQVKSILQPVGFNTLGCQQCGAKFLKSDGRSGAIVGGLKTGWGVLDPDGDN